MVVVAVVVVVVVGGVALVVLVMARVGKGTSPRHVRPASAGITRTTGTTLAPCDDKGYPPKTMLSQTQNTWKKHTIGVGRRQGGRPVIPEGIRLAAKGLRPGQGLLA